MDLEEWRQTKVKNLNLKGYKKHIFLCVGEACGQGCGADVWQYLKLRLLEEGLSQPEDVVVQRSQSPCLRVCREGPIAVVYPEGVWYQKVDQKVCEQIIQDHFKNDKIVEQAVLAQMQS